MGDGVRQFELPCIDAFEIGVPSRPGGGAPFRGRTESFQMYIFYPGLFECSPKRRLRESGPARKRQRADVDHSLNADALKSGNEFADRGALVTDCKNAHATIRS